jgi:hypothetical protein
MNGNRRRHQSYEPPAGSSEASTQERAREEITCSPHEEIRKGTQSYFGAEWLTMPPCLDGSRASRVAHRVALGTRGRHLRDSYDVRPRDCMGNPEGSVVGRFSPAPGAHRAAGGLVHNPWALERKAGKGSVTAAQ